MNDERFLHVSDVTQGEVRRYKMNGTDGRADRLSQLSFPTYPYVDRRQAVYVSDSGNDRVMKWEGHVREGLIVAGGQGDGNAVTQLSNPQGVFVDQMGTVYVVDSNNHRVMRWYNESTQGRVIVGGNGAGCQANQLYGPSDVSFDQHGNIYVVDRRNDRVQRFSIEASCLDELSMNTDSKSAAYSRNASNATGMNLCY